MSGVRFLVPAPTFLLASPPESAILDLRHKERSVRLQEFQPRKATYGFKTTFGHDILEVCTAITTALGPTPDPAKKTWWIETNTSNGTGTLNVYINDVMLRDQLYDFLNA